MSGVSAVVNLLVRSVPAARGPRGLARVRSRWDHAVAPAGAGGKHSVIADLVRARGRDEGYQSAEELVRLEHICVVPSRQRWRRW